MDGEIGRVLDALAASHYADNTVVAFVSDHGEGIAMHQWNQKQVLYDACTRVPLILAGPDIRQGNTSSTLVSTALDIPQTLLDMAGASVPDSMRGTSLRALASGATGTLERKHVVAETVFARNTDLLGLRGRMLRTEKYKYCVYDAGENREQLFDMTADPGETNNLAVQSEHQGVLKQQRTLLSQWAADTLDNDFPYVAV